jgi:uncharacterized damage-inducible protein DinB
MSVTPAARFRRLFEYERASHAKVLAALRAVPEDRRSTLAFQKAVDLLAHVVAARRMWLARFGVAAAPAGGLEPTGTTLADLGPRLDDMHERWTSYLAGLSDEGVARVFEYRSLDAGWFRNTIDDVLTQLYGHSLYHRAQIATLLRALGCEPPITDYIYWAREPIAEPTARTT